MKTNLLRGGARMMRTFGEEMERVILPILRQGCAKKDDVIKVLQTLGRQAGVSGTGGGRGDGADAGENAPSPTSGRGDGADAGEDDRRWIFVVADELPGGQIGSMLHPNTADLATRGQLSWCNFVPGLWHVQMHAFKALREIGYGYWGRPFASHYGWDNSPAQLNSFVQAKDVHKAVDGLRVELEGSQDAGTFLFLREFLAGFTPEGVLRCPRFVAWLNAHAAGESSDPMDNDTIEEVNEVLDDLWPGREQGPGPGGDLLHFLREWKDDRASRSQDYRVTREFYERGVIPIVALVRGGCREGDGNSVVAGLKLSRWIWLAGPVSHHRVAKLVQNLLCDLHILRTSGRPDENRLYEVIRDECLFFRGTSGSRLMNDESGEFLVKALKRMLRGAEESSWHNLSSVLELALELEERVSDTLLVAEDSSEEKHNVMEQLRPVRRGWMAEVIGWFYGQRLSGEHPDGPLAVGMHGRALVDQSYAELLERGHDNFKTLWHADIHNHSYSPQRATLEVPPDPSE